MPDPIHPMYPRTYVGDGLYAYFDGFTLWLHAEVDGREHKVAMEYQAFQTLREFAKDCWGEE